MKPKAFLSYSWSSAARQQLVLRCAERLIADGVDVVLDLYDLKEGDDKNHFMESMVTDKTVTHALLFCDKAYTEKANSRKAGVGTESQIVSKAVYESVKQSKFIPLVCEFDPEGEPYLPTFLQSRIYIDFSSQESINSNWEKLIRLLFGKPLYVKPQVGNAPAYVKSDAIIHSNPAIGKFQTLRQALIEERKSVKAQRRDFLDACFSFADQFRVRSTPDSDLAEKILKDCDELVPLRDLLVDWVLLESEIRPSTEFNDAVITALEMLRELKSRPNEVSSWSESWFEALRLFAYEVFLYFVAALLKTGSYELLHEIYTTHYITPQTEQHREDKFEQFSCFYAHSEMLNKPLSPPGQTLHSAAAELLKRHASKAEIPFGEILQADLLSLLLAFIQKDIRWYPQTLYYSSFARTFPFFVRAAQHKHFMKLAIITGITNAETLRVKVKEGQERLNTNRWNSFYFDRTFWASMNMDALDTIK